jgi:hypothetical protein
LITAWGIKIILKATNLSLWRIEINNIELRLNDYKIIVGIIITIEGIDLRLGRIEKEIIILKLNDSIIWIKNYGFIIS